MALYKLEEFYPNYRKELFDGDEIKGLDVYAGRTGEKIGTIDTALVDDEGRFRYFVIDTGFWIFGKKVLLPVGYCQINEQARRIYATGIRNKTQVEDLPEYNDDTRVNRKYEERVNEVYRGSTSHPNAISAQAISNSVYDSDTYNYQHEPSLYNLNASDHQTFKLHEERLIANKHRRQTGEVVIGKHVETETARVSIPIEKERVIVERTTPANTSPSNIDFHEGEVVRMKVYEETADVHKEAFVREEVRIKKEVERDTVQAEETIRREELDIDTQNRQAVNRRYDQF